MIPTIDDKTNKKVRKLSEQQTDIENINSKKKILSFFLYKFAVNNYRFIYLKNLISNICSFTASSIVRIQIINNFKLSYFFFDKYHDFF